MKGEVSSQLLAIGWKLRRESPWLAHKPEALMENAKKATLDCERLVFAHSFGLPEYIWLDDDNNRVSRLALRRLRPKMMSRVRNTIRTRGPILVCIDVCLSGLLQRASSH